MYLRMLHWSRHRSSASRLILLLAAAACGDDPAAPSGPCPTSDGGARVAVHVSAGVSPTLTWQPGCRVHALVVQPADSRNAPALWEVQTDTTNAIDSGVRYGEPLAGSTVVTAPEPLTTGVRYEAVLIGWSRTTGRYAVGSRVFTP